VRRRRVGRPSSVARSGARGVGLRARVFVVVSRRAARVRRRGVDAVARNVPSWSTRRLRRSRRRSRRRVTRGAPIFDVARAVAIHSSASFVGARGTDRRPRRRRRVEWVNGPRECVSLRETSQRRAAQPAEEAENSHDDGNRGGVSNVGTRGRWIDARSSDARGGTAREGDEGIGVERARRRRRGGSRGRDDDGARGERRGVVEKFGGERRVGSQGEAEERFIRR